MEDTPANRLAARLVRAVALKYGLDGEVRLTKADLARADRAKLYVVRGTEAGTLVYRAKEEL